MRGGKPQKGQCVVCFEYYTEENPKSRHHILPKRFYGGNGGLFEMCRNCHNKLEKLIPLRKKLETWQYKQILEFFIKSHQPRQVV